MDISGLDELDLRELRLQDGDITLQANSTDANDLQLIFHKSRNATDGVHTVVEDDDKLGSIQFKGSDGDTFEIGAEIFARVNGTPGDGDMPGELVFATTADSASSATERMIIDSSGNVGIGKTPECILDISGNEGQIKLKSTNSAKYTNILLESSGGDKWQISGPRGETEGNLGFYYVDGSSFSAELLSITKDGNVGIGTSSPSGKIDIVNNSSNTSMNFYSYTKGEGIFRIGTDTTEAHRDHAFRKILLYVSDTDSSNDAQMYFVRNGVWKSHNDFSSDSRIKLNQTEFPTTESLNIVKTIKVKEYYNSDLQKTVKGFIAQEVEAILPEAVTSHDLSEYGKESDFRFLDYRRLQVHTFGAIQNQESRIETLEQVINIQQTTITDLISRIEALENA